MKLCPRCEGLFPDEVEFCSKDGSALVPRVEAAAPGADPLVGTVLGGKLRLERKVAEGGMGRIYEARHVALGRRLAVKVLSDQFTQNEEAVLRFQREARTAAALDNPNIVEVIDIDRTPDGRYYIVMEFLEGEELRATIRRLGVLPLDHIVRIFRQVGRALDAAHQKGIVHRDLKPENIFLCSRGDGEEVAKVVDFGISKIRSGDAKLTQTGAVMGTPYYMAPEQARGDTSLDHRADVYALGAILYEATTGRLPSQGDSPTAILMKIILEDPTPPRMVNSSIPEAVEQVIVKAMAKGPEERYQSVRALVDDLALAAGAGATGIPLTAPHATVGPGRPPSQLGSLSAAAPVAPLAATALGAGPWPETAAQGPAAAPSGFGAVLSTPFPGAGGPSGVGQPVPFATPTPPGPPGSLVPPAPARSMGWLVPVAIVAGCLVLGGTIAGVVLSRRGAGEGVAPPTADAPEAAGTGGTAVAAPDQTPTPGGTDAGTGPSTGGSVQVLFASEPPGAEVVRDGEVLCSPTPCTSPFPANSGEVTVAMRAEGRRDATLIFATHETNLTVTGQLPETGSRRGGGRPGSGPSGDRPPTKTGPGAQPGSGGSTSPGFAASPFAGKAPPGSGTKAPTVVGNPFDR